MPGALTDVHIDWTENFTGVPVRVDGISDGGAAPGGAPRPDGDTVTSVNGTQPAAPAGGATANGGQADPAVVPVGAQGNGGTDGDGKNAATVPTQAAPPAPGADGGAPGGPGGGAPGGDPDPAAPAPTFSAASIQSAFASAKTPPSPNQIEALQALDKGQSGPWAKVSWPAVQASAAMRVITPSLIDQATLNVCGSAAALEAEAATNAKGFADEVIHIFTKAELGGTKVNKDLLANDPLSGMDVCDWMMLSAAQDTSNKVRDFDGRPSVNLGAARSEGTFAGNEEFLLKNLDEAKKTDVLRCQLTGEDANTEKVEALMKKYGDKVTVLVHCDGGMLAKKDGPVDGNGDSSANPIQGSDHVVRLISIKYSDLVTFKIFTWGQEVELSWDIRRYRKWIYGYVVGAKDDSVELP